MIQPGSPVQRVVAGLAIGVTQTNAWGPDRGASSNDVGQQRGQRPELRTRFSEEGGVLTLHDDHRPAVAPSNPTWRQFTVLWQSLMGADGSTARLRVQGRDGKEESLTVVRRHQGRPPPQRSGPIVEVLAGNVGYVDLDRLQPGAVGAMFEALRGTRGIVFDMRGYPQMTGREIAARLNVRRAKVGAPPPLPAGPRRRAEARRKPELHSEIPETTGWIYPGTTAMLIDERTMSRAEDTVAPLGGRASEAS